MMNLQYCMVVINNSQVVGHTQLSQNFIHRSSDITYYTRGSVFRCQASVILQGEVGKEKAY